MKRICFALAFTTVAAAASAGQPQAAAGAAVYKEHCASCHEGGAERAPSRDALRSRSPQSILAALTSGPMAPIGAELSEAERQAVAAFLVAPSAPSAPSAPPSTAPSAPSAPPAPPAPPSTAPSAPSAPPAPSAPSAPPSTAPSAPSAPPAPSAPSAQGLCPSAPPPLATPSPSWNGWGNDPSNARFQPAAAAGLTPETVPQLTLKWVFAFPGATTATTQPAVVGNRVFVGSEAGGLWSLSLTTGCTYWKIETEGGVRTAPTVQRVGNRHAVFFGDLKANVYAVDADTGEQIWKFKADPHAFARITGAPSFHNGRLYVSVSSVEEVPAARPNYPCCTFRGSVIALDAATGKKIWQTFTIAEEPAVYTKNSAGTALSRPAGAAVWSSPTLDVAKNTVYVGTGNAYTEPAAATSDSVLALDMNTGAIRWHNQITPKDSYLVGCKPGVGNCPGEMGPDHDFGSSPILRTVNGRRVLLIGQKSGVMYALDPDNGGKVLWQQRVGKGSELGGIEWGPAADMTTVYVANSDVIAQGTGPSEQAGGLHAIRIVDGERVWHTPAPPLTCKGGPGCSGAQSAAVTAIPGVVFSGSIDGHIRAYASRDGKILWEFNTMRDFETVNGVKGAGGSIDGAGPVVVNGMLLTNSGYGRFRGKPGNVLLAFGVK